MVQKWFVVSDLHSFCTELLNALNEVKFDLNNPEHGLIVVGDIFDRGKETLEIYKFIKSIPQDRRILIKGNHEDCYKDLLIKNFPDNYDYHNGTVSTFCQIAKVDMQKLSLPYLKMVERIPTDMAIESIRNTWDVIVNKVKESEITKFIYSDEWKDYYELEHKFIITHSFIPLATSNQLVNPLIYGPLKYWREATPIQWEIARWGCPYENYLKGYFKEEENKGKTLICGHWHTSDFYKYLNGEEKDGIYFSNGIIGIDNGVQIKNGEFLHQQNVLIIDIKNKTYGDLINTYNY